MRELDLQKVSPACTTFVGQRRWYIWEFAFLCVFYGFYLCLPVASMLWRMFLAFCSMLFYLSYFSQCCKTKSISPFQAVPTSKGQALADEYGINFFETVSSNFSCWCDFISSCKHFLHIGNFLSQSAKTNLNVEKAFFSIAKDVMQRLAEADSKAQVGVRHLNIKC